MRTHWNLEIDGLLDCDKTKKISDYEISKLELDDPERCGQEITSFRIQILSLELEKNLKNFHFIL